ncbi:hypothetical protein EDC04DRAFT_2682262 [Pisolithus marmoratus]|nr:hypothetical protein EDC04DRAFT_2682262 [Pisolithus marmoratus]
MYAANNYGPKSPGSPAQFSNNPFLDDPSNPYTRFPDITGSSSLQSPPQQFQAGYGTGYANDTQYQAQQYPYWQQQQQQYSGQYPGQPQIQNQSHFTSTSYTPQYTNTSHQFVPQPAGAGFQLQPTSTFGQQTSSQLYGYNDSSQQYSNQSYPQQYSPSYLSEFDPYAKQQPASPNHSQLIGSSRGNGPRGDQHPRDFLRSHKTELEAWDPYAWKQLINSCEALKDAWIIRKQHAENTVRQYGGGSPGFFGAAPQGYGYNNNPLIEGWKQAMKEAESNVDIAAASVFQLQEVYSSYRQSGDLASKRRVREATNAALTGLPDWPGPLS